MLKSRLKELRTSNSITQEQLAAAIGVERSSIGKTEGNHYVLSQNSIDEAIDRLLRNSFPENVNAVVFLLHKPIGHFILPVRFVLVVSLVGDA